MNEFSGELNNAVASSPVRPGSHYSKNDGDSDGNSHDDVNETRGNGHTVHGSTISVFQPHGAFA